MFSLGIPYLPRRRPTRFLLVSGRHGLQPDELDLRLVVQLQVRRHPRLLPHERRPPETSTNAGRHEEDATLPGNGLEQKTRIQNGRHGSKRNPKPVLTKNEVGKYLEEVDEDNRRWNVESAVHC